MNGNARGGSRYRERERRKDSNRTRRGVHADGSKCCRRAEFTRRVYPFRGLSALTEKKRRHTN